MNKKKKKNTAGSFLMKFFAFILLLIGIYFLSYFGTSKWYSAHLDKRDVEEQEKADIKKQNRAEKSAEKCKFQMVYLDDPATEKVDFSLLRVFNRMSGNMSVFMIPADSEITLTDKMQNKLTEKAGTHVEKTLPLAEIGTYFGDSNTKYKMINKVMEEIMGGIRISSYEYMNYDQLMQVIDLAAPVKTKLGDLISYVDEEGHTLSLTPNDEHEIDGRKALAVLTYDDGFGLGDSGRIKRSADYLTKYVTSITKKYNEEQMADYLKKYYEIVGKGGSGSDYEGYIHDCLKLDEENLSFYSLKGEQEENVYVLDVEKIREDIKIVMGEEAYAIATEGKQKPEQTKPEAVTEVLSKDKAIGIYNSTKINGLAAGWKEKLEAEGYQVQGVYDYSGDPMTTGKIIVREEGMGKDLQKNYFPDVVIETGDPENGEDIQIVLGETEDF